MSGVVIEPPDAGESADQTGVPVADGAVIAGKFIQSHRSEK
jgi:hypothetical protein